MAPLPLPVTVAVAGVSFRQEEIRSVVEGDVLVLTAQDDNPHDASAVSVSTRDGALLGYVPRSLAPRLRATGARTWPARIKEILRNETWGLRIEIHPSAAKLESPRDRIAAALQRGTKDAPPHGISILEPGHRPGQPPVTPAARRVMAPSGRFLGYLLRIEDDRVIAVRDGVEVSFPSRAVSIRDAE